VFSTPKGAASLFLATVIGLIVLKVVVGTLTHAISIWAQAADSSLDFLAVVLTFATVGYAGKEPDREHPFGHGKAEGVAAGVQAILIFGASALIIWSAVQRLVSGAAVQLTEAGMAVMAVSIVASILLSRHLFKVARATGSTILEANAHNIRADIYSASGVLVGLAVVRLTGLAVLDPIIALAMSAFILKAGYDVSRRAFGELLDIRLSPEEEAEIMAAIEQHQLRVAGFHALRTRKAGTRRFVDLHLVMPPDCRLAEAHDLCDAIEESIKGRLQSSSITIHVEPCNEQCEQCLITCRPESRPGGGPTGAP
jgi:cation diffusion facilitator family transporter